MEKKKESNLVYLIKQVRPSFMNEVLSDHSVKRIVHVCQESRRDKSIQGKRDRGGNNLRQRRDMTRIVLSAAQ